MARHGGFPWRASRCVSCQKLAVKIDDETGQYLCLIHWQLRMALRQAIRNAERGEGYRRSTRAKSKSPRQGKNGRKGKPDSA